MVCFTSSILVFMILDVLYNTIFDDVVYSTILDDVVYNTGIDDVINTTQFLMT